MMVKCPACDHSVFVVEQDLGRAVVCPSCSGTFRPTQEGTPTNQPSTEPPPLKTEVVRYRDAPVTHDVRPAVTTYSDQGPMASVGRLLSILAMVLGPIAILFRGLAVHNGLTIGDLLCAACLVMGGFTSRSFLNPANREGKLRAAILSGIALLFCGLMAADGYNALRRVILRDDPEAQFFLVYLAAGPGVVIGIVFLAVLTTPAKATDDLLPP